jgi:ATP-binding cassette subfamily F protein uup
VKVAYLAQELEPLDPDLRVLAAAQEAGRIVRTASGEQTVTSLLEQFGFTPVSMQTRVVDLSGGERRRLQLLRLLLSEPNVLVLDEPTNDLDIDTLTVLEDHLDGWPGTVVLVTHDRYVLERVCDVVYGMLGDGAVRMLPGGVEEYLRRRSRSTGADGAAAGFDLERQLGKLSARETALHDRLANAAGEGADHVQLATLSAELDAVVAERTLLEDQWLSVAEVAES